MSDDSRYAFGAAVLEKLGRPRASHRPKCARAGDASGFALVTDRQGFAALEADWRRLHRRMDGAGNPFLAYEWNRLWLKHYLDDEEAGESLAIVVGRKAGEVDLIWPLVFERKWGLRLLSFIGPPVSQYGDVLTAGNTPPRRMVACWEFVRELLAPDAFVARKVRDDALIAPFFHNVDAMLTLADEAPFADLAKVEDFEDFETRYSRNFRRGKRRKRKLLAQAGRLGFEVQSASGEAGALTETAIAMKSAWLRQTGQIAPGFGDERFRAFFRDLSKAEHDDLRCYVCALQLDGKPIAIEIGVASAGRYCAHIGAYELAFANLSPGTEQIAQTIERLLQDGVTRYDLLAPQSEYKWNWADASIAVRDWVVPNSFKGRVFATLYLKWLRPHLKRGVVAVSASASRLLPQGKA